MKLINTLTQLRPQKILVVGDFMLDSYTRGVASRISPEAPVAVVRVTEESSLPGGAGNVALNLISLGMEVAVLGRWGSDKAGEKLYELLGGEGVNLQGFYKDDSCGTPIKNRVIVSQQQMIRIDHEEFNELPYALEEKIIESLPALLEGVKVVALSDYGKGFLTRGLIQAILKTAKNFNIPVLVDPKGADFTKYRGATLLKPNLKEALAAASSSKETSLDEIASTLRLKGEIDTLMITRSEEGISLFSDEGRRDFPVKVKEVRDVTGAGDTVLALLAAATASGLSFDEGAKLANVAASLAIEHVGCARITLPEIAERLLDEQESEKVIGPELFPALQFALKNRPHTLLELSEESMLDPALYDKIQSLKVTSEHTLLMSVPQQPKSHHLIPMLTSLKEVDFVILR